MKRIIILLVTVMVFFGCQGFAEDTTPSAEVDARNETIIHMQYTVRFEDYEREGLYSGELKNGLPDGFGVFVTQNAVGIEWHYIGEWKNGMFNGEGAQYWEIGSVTKGVYQDNIQITGHAKWNKSLLTDWLDDYDTDGNRHFISYYYNGNTQIKYCEGYADVSKKTVVTVSFYDSNGTEIESPQSITVTAISFMQ